MSVSLFSCILFFLDTLHTTICYIE